MINDQIFFTTFFILMLIYANFVFFDFLEPNFFKANQLNFKETLQASKTFSPPLRKGQVE